MNPNEDKSRKTKMIIYLCACAFTLFCTIHMTMAFDYLEGEEQTVLNALILGMKHMNKYPLNITITEHFWTGFGYVTLVLAIAFLYFFFIERKTRFGKEHGDAVWASMKERMKLKDNDYFKNMILSNDLFMSMNTRFTRRNNNQVIVGGSGSGKTRFVAKPNMLQMNCSYVVTDPKGDLMKSCGKMFEENGYDVRVFNLLEPEHSGCYNPFFYLHSEADIFKLAKQVIKSTKDKDSQGAAGQDPFWENAEQAWYSSIFSFIWLELPPEQQNFNTVMKLLNIAGASEDNENQESELDIIFRKLEEEKGADYFPCKQYRIYKLAPGKTAKSILISAGVRLAPFNVAEIMNLVSTDTIDLKSIGDKKTVLFISIPDRANPYDFLVSLLYTQLFDELYFQADFGEVKWSGNKVLYRSKESLFEQKKQLMDTYETYLRTEEEKKRDRLRKKLQKQLKEIEKEFGIPCQLFDRDITDKEILSYLRGYEDAINTCLIRLRNRLLTLEGYKSLYLRHKKALMRLDKSTSKYKEKSIAKIQSELEAVQMRLKYEYGIEKNMPNPKKNPTPEELKQIEKRYIEDISFLIKELKMNPQNYGTRQSLEDKREKLKMLEDDIKMLNERIKDTGKKQVELRNKLLKEVHEKERDIDRINNLARYEFGIDDLQKIQKNGGRLPVHVRCIEDEFANVAPVPDFDKLVATMRSREISVSIILQTISQLKTMYKDAHETIIGNCDSFVFLGGQEQSTMEYLVKRMGKETIDKRSQGISKGRQGSSSTNWDTLGRDLISANALTTMDNEDCIVFVRGFNPFYCKKFKLEKHPNYNKMGEVDKPSDPRLYDFYHKFNTKELAMSVYDKQMGMGDEYKKMLSDSIEAHIRNIDRMQLMGGYVKLADRMSFTSSNTYQPLANAKSKAREVEKKIEQTFIHYARDGRVRAEMEPGEMKRVMVQDLDKTLFEEQEEVTKQEEENSMTDNSMIDNSLFDADNVIETVPVSEKQRDTELLEQQGEDENVVPGEQEDYVPEDGNEQL